MRLPFLAAIFLISSSTAHGQQPMTLEQAIRMAVTSNPRIGEAAANRRAVDHELRQVQGGLLPQIRVQAEYGNERSRRAAGSAIAGTNEWRKAGGEAGIIVNQLLFDGFCHLEPDLPANGPVRCRGLANTRTRRACRTGYRGGLPRHPALHGLCRPRGGKRRCA